MAGAQTQNGSGAADAPVTLRAFTEDDLLSLDRLCTDPDALGVSDWPGSSTAGRAAAAERKTGTSA